MLGGKSKNNKLLKLIFKQSSAFLRNTCYKAHTLFPNSKSSLPASFPFFCFLYTIFQTFSRTQEDEAVYGNTLEVKIHKPNA